MIHPCKEEHWLKLEDCPAELLEAFIADLGADDPADWHALTRAADVAAVRLAIPVQP
jgi:hypothetical protein